jgi:hypothetical protein
MQDVSPAQFYCRTQKLSSSNAGRSTRIVLLQGVEHMGAVSRLKPNKTPQLSCVIGSMLLLCSWPLYGHVLL